MDSRTGAGVHRWRRARVCGGSIVAVQNDGCEARFEMYIYIEGLGFKYVLGPWTHGPGAGHGTRASDIARRRVRATRRDLSFGSGFRPSVRPSVRSSVRHARVEANDDDSDDDVDRSIL